MSLSALWKEHMPKISETYIALFWMVRLARAKHIANRVKWFSDGIYIDLNWIIYSYKIFSGKIKHKISSTYFYYFFNL